MFTFQWSPQQSWADGDRLLGIEDLAIQNRWPSLSVFVGLSHHYAVVRDICQHRRVTMFCRARSAAATPLVTLRTLASPRKPSSVITTISILHVEQLRLQFIILFSFV